MTRLDSLARVLMILSPICSVISAKADYTPNFASGSIPKDITVSNDSEAKPLGDFYKHGWTKEGWTVDRFGGKGYVVMAPTRTGTQEPVNSLMTFPAQDITSGTWLQWEALSLLPGFRESYRVLVAPEGGEAVEVFSTDAENSEWTLHMVPLNRFAGSRCTVSFLCNSVNRYMLMLSGITLGAPKQNSVELSDRTPRYGDMSGTTVRGTIRNTGAALENASIVCYLADGSEAGKISLGDLFDTDRTADFAFDLPAVMDEATGYTLAVAKSDGSQILAGTGSFYSSSFTRTLLVDKATGMWCTNCPKGNLLLEGMQKTYGDRMVTVETHIYNNDPLENVEYWNGLGFHAVPYFKLNRIQSSACGDLKQFSGHYETPTRFGIRFGSIHVDGNEAVAIDVEVTAAEQFDNSSDRYRVGYVMTAGFRSDSYYQTNGCSSPSDMRYYYLPKRVPGELLEFHNVSLTSLHAFGGIPGSLPAEITPGDGMACGFTVSRPELLENLRDGRMVVYVLDTETGQVLNTAARSLDEDYSGVRPPLRDDASGMVVTAGNGLLGVRVDGEWSLRCYDMSGSLLMERTGHGVSMVDTRLISGVYIARLDYPQGYDTLKFTVK